jgi:tRNA threonylcarbamoyladenosine biosynthesis protein TsaE
MKELILTKKEVQLYAKEVSLKLLNKKILCLRGNLGAGKTFFASKVIQNLTQDITLNITSPTFSIVNVYNTKDEKSIHHFDFYRLKSFNELENIGFFDAIEEGICIIEWWDIFEGEMKNLLKNAIFIDIINVSSTKRKFIYYEGE